MDAPDPEVSDLEVQLQQLQAQHAALARSNQQLQDKQAAQMDILVSSEEGLSAVGSVVMRLQAAKSGGGGSEAGAPVQHSEQEQGAESAVVLALLSDLQAHRLMQQLAPSASTGGLGTAGPASTGALSGGDSAAAARSARQLMAGVTPEAVAELAGISTRDLAVRLRAAVMRVSLMHTCRPHAAASMADTRAAAVRDFAQLVMVAVVAAEMQFLEVSCLNLDTLAREDAPEDLWPAVAAAAALTPQQQEGVRLAYGTYLEHREPLLCRQRAVTQKLGRMLWLSQDSVSRHEADRAKTKAFVAAATGRAATSAVVASAGSGGAAQGAVGHPGRLSLLEAASIPDVFHHWSVTAVAPMIEVDAAIEELSSLVAQLSEWRRQLVCSYFGLLDDAQHAAAILAAYPFLVDVTALFAHVWETRRADAAEGAP